MDFGEMIILIVATVPAFLLMFGMGIMLVVTKGAKGDFLLAGWNTMKPEKKARYNKEALFTFIGWLFIALSVLMVVFVVGAAFGVFLLMWGAGLAWSFLMIGGLVYANAGKRFRNPTDNDSSFEDKQEG